ncbi:MAG: hypothetical protein WCE63_11865 [Acidobacteriaceae bacterium]
MTTSKICGADPLWKWHGSLDEGLRNKLAAAVRATWSYACLSAWSYLHDEAMAAEIMEDAVEIVRAYALRAPSSPSVEKITARLRSQVRRRTKQLANRRRKEGYAGSLQDLEMYAPSSNPDPTELLLLNQVLNLLSPQAKEVAEWIRMGYSWREIGKTFGIDHSSIRLAFRREVDAVLIQMGRGKRIGR